MIAGFCAACNAYFNSFQERASHFAAPDADVNCLTHRGNYPTDGRTIAKNPALSVTALLNFATAYPAEVLSNPVLPLLELEVPAQVLQLRTHCYQSLIRNLVYNSRRDDSYPGAELPVLPIIMRWAAHCEVLAWRPSRDVVCTEVESQPEKDNPAKVLVWTTTELNVVYVAPYAHQLTHMVEYLPANTNEIEPERLRRRYELLQQYTTRGPAPYDHFCGNCRYGQRYQDLDHCRWHDAYYRGDCWRCTRGKPLCQHVPFRFGLRQAYLTVTPVNPHNYAGSVLRKSVEVDTYFGFDPEERLHLGVHPYGPLEPRHTEKRYSKPWEDRARYW